MQHPPSDPALHGPPSSRPQVSGLKKRDKLAPGQSSKPQMDDGENVDSEQMLAE